MYVFKCTVIISTQYLLIFNLLFRVTVSTLLSLVSPAYKLFYHFQHVNVKLCLSKYILSWFGFDLNTITLVCGYAERRRDTVNAITSSESQESKTATHTPAFRHGPIYRPSYPLLRQSFIAATCALHDVGLHVRVARQATKGQQDECSSVQGKQIMASVISYWRYVALVVVLWICDVRCCRLRHRRRRL